MAYYDVGDRFETATLAPVKVAVIYELLELSGRPPCEGEDHDLVVWRESVDEVLHDRHELVRLGRNHLDREVW